MCDAWKKFISATHWSLRANVCHRGPSREFLAYLQDLHIVDSEFTKSLPKITHCAQLPIMPHRKTRSVSTGSLESMNVTKDGFPLPSNAQRLERRKGLLDVSFVRRMHPQKGDSDNEPFTDSESDKDMSDASSTIVSEGSQSKQSNKSDSDKDNASEKVRI